MFRNSIVSEPRPKKTKPKRAKLRRSGIINNKNK
jgi:hypothetical protein